MQNETYNGWTNYATWRVNLEIFDGNDWNEESGSYSDVADLADALKERAYDAVSEYGMIPDNSLVMNYADAFLSEVNYYEIAQHIADDYPSIIQTV
jgi:hypothetical protein